MHIIIDGVFNHVGLTFWAFQDVINKRENSDYFKWFNIDGSGLPDKSHLNDYKDLPAAFIPNSEAPMRYTGYVEDLPAFRQDSLASIEQIRNHLHYIIKRWMDPNGDGDPSDAIDGWRLCCPTNAIKSSETDFGNGMCNKSKCLYQQVKFGGEDYLNNKQFDASPWLASDRFDAVMNYRFGDAMFNFFTHNNINN